MMYIHEQQKQRIKILQWLHVSPNRIEGKAGTVKYIKKSFHTVLYSHRTYFNRILTLLLPYYKSNTYINPLYFYRIICHSHFLFVLRSSKKMINSENCWINDKYKGLNGAERRVNERLEL